MRTTPPRRAFRLPRRGRRAAIVLVVLGTVTSLVGAVPPARAAEPPPFAGTVDEFYVPPDPLPPGPPGDLIRLMPVGSANGRTTMRIMYHSRDAQDRDRAVTGMLTYPDAPAPDGGWPVVSTAHGTTGLASPCAVSRNGLPAPDHGLAGVAVASDYIGLGPPGELQPYLSRPSEAHAVIDAVRAARNVAAAGAGPRWSVVGGSQGGHGSISASELAGSYAPELQLVGAVAFAPAAMFDRVYNPIDRIVTDIVGVMALYGAVSEHPEIDPATYVTPQTAAVAASVLPTECLGAIIPAFVAVPSAGFWLQDPRTTEPARSMSLANDVGNVRSGAPLLLVSGTADTIVFIERSRDLLARLCATGQVTEYTEYEGATHDSIGAAASGQALTFLQARLRGDPPVDSCLLATAPTTSPPATAAQPVAVSPSFTG